MTTKDDAKQWQDIVANAEPVEPAVFYVEDSKDLKRIIEAVRETCEEDS